VFKGRQNPRSRSEQRAPKEQEPKEHKARPVLAWKSATNDESEDESEGDSEGDDKDKGSCERRCFSMVWRTKRDRKPMRSSRSSSALSGATVNMRIYFLFIAFVSMFRV
jgi:hypothetical protein